MRLFTIVVAGIMCAMPAFAQEGPRRGGGEGEFRGQGPRGGGGEFRGQGGRGFTGALMQIENAESVWKLQAEHAAAKLGISEEHTAELVTAYTEMRREHGRQLQEIMASRGDDGDPRGRMQETMAAQQEATEKARKQLKTAAAKFLDADQASKVADTLGVFHRQWDPMVNLVQEFELSGKAQSTALDQIHGYVMEAHKLQTERRGSGDFGSMREQMDTLSQKLDGEMKHLLSDDQFARWQEATQQRRGGPGGGGRRGNF